MSARPPTNLGKVSDAGGQGFSVIRVSGCGGVSKHFVGKYKEWK
jgi:hypothetical protein